MILLSAIYSIRVTHCQLSNFLYHSYRDFYKMKIIYFNFLVISSFILSACQATVIETMSDTAIVEVNVDHSKKNIYLSPTQDIQGHGPDSGSAESIGALFWRGNIDAAVIESFYLAAKNGVNKININSIQLSDASALYLTNEHSFMALSDALYSGIKRQQSALTQTEWQQFWRRSPKSGTLKDWVNFCELIINR